MSAFEHVKFLPSDPIFGIEERFRKDKKINKVDLLVGTYRSSDLKTHVLRSVLEAEKILINSKKNKNYLPIIGKESFIKCVQNLVFGEFFFKKSNGRLFGLQSLGATGGLRIGGEFLKKEVTSRVYVSDPTWSNHIGIFEGCGMVVEKYPYYNKKTHTIDYEKMLNFFDQIPEKSAVVLHACCHNPTGCDLNSSQWKELSVLFLKRKIIPFFDFAYQGFGRGIEKDSWALRHFAEKGHEMFVAVSFSKNFTLYGERVGCLCVLSENSQISQNIESVIKRLVRSSYSNPPLHGSEIVTTILQDHGLKEMWINEVEQMRIRVEEKREELANSLAEQFGKDKFGFIKRRLGLFSILDLTKEQVKRLQNEYGIYCTNNSRINLTGLSLDNLPYVIEAIVKTDR